MIVTNSKIIIGTDWPEKDFKALMKRLSEKAKKEIEAVTGVAFPIVKEPYLHAENKFSIQFAELQQLFMSEDYKLEFRAIGNEIVQVPGNAYKEVQVPLNPEQKEDIATAMCKTQEDKDEVEADKKEHNKQCAAKLESLENRMSELVSRFRKGYDEKNIKCVMMLDFEQGIKNFVSEESGEVIASEAMQPSDYQMKLDYVPGFIETPAEPTDPEQPPFAVEREDDLPI